MFDNVERRQGNGWLWVVGLLAAAMGGLVVYARMRPESGVGKRVNGASVTLCEAARRCPLWQAMTRCCRDGEGNEGEGERVGLPSEGEGEA
jgi:hypothetical protein